MKTHLCILISTLALVNGLQRDPGRNWLPHWANFSIPNSWLNSMTLNWKLKVLLPSICQRTKNKSRRFFQRKNSLQPNRSKSEQDTGRDQTGSGSQKIEINREYARHVFRWIKVALARTTRFLLFPFSTNIGRRYGRPSRWQSALVHHHRID